MQRHFVLRLSARWLVPLIVLFGFYVQFHGDFGPGGGFQAGVIIAVGLIFYGLVHGADSLRELVPPVVLRYLSAGGVLLYAGVGVISLFLGGNYLDYGVLAENSVTGQHLGIFLIELGVGLTVAAVMLAVFYCFAD